MAFESNNFKVARKTLLQKGTITVDCNISTNDEISKVLTISTDVSLSGSELLNGVINYSGIVDACIVYLNNEGEIGKINSTCPFSSKVSNDAIKIGQKSNIVLKVVDNSIEALSSDNVRLSVAIEERISLYDNVDVNSVKCSDEDVCIQDEVININQFIGQATETTIINTNFNIKENIKRVLLTESQVLIKSAEAGTNFVSVMGDVVTRVLYLNENDKFEAVYATESFKEEIELDGVNRESQVEASAVIKRDSVNVGLEQDDKNSKISLEIPVVITAEAYSVVDSLIVKDLYSTKHDLKITTSSFEMTNICQSSIIESKIDGSLSLGEDRPRVDKIMFVGGNSVAISNAYLNDNEITIEGIARTNVVYLNDEDGSLNSVELEVPFVITDKFNVENIGGNLDIDAIVCDVDVAVKKGRELFYDAKVKAIVNYCYDNISAVISQVEASEDYPEKDYGVELIFAKEGQTSWEIAKEMKVKEDLLVEQNPDVIFPLLDNQNLVLFYQKVNQ